MWLLPPPPPPPRPALLSLYALTSSLFCLPSWTLSLSLSPSPSLDLVLLAFFLGRWNIYLLNPSFFRAFAPKCPTGGGVLVSSNSPSDRSSNVFTWKFVELTPRIRSRKNDQQTESFDRKEAGAGHYLRQWICPGWWSWYKQRGDALWIASGGGCAGCLSSAASVPAMM